MIYRYNLNTNAGTNDLDGICGDMAITSIASVTEKEVHRHRITLKATWEKSLNRDFAPFPAALNLGFYEAIPMCRISAVSEGPTTFGL